MLLNSVSKKFGIFPLPKYKDRLRLALEYWILFLQKNASMAKTKEKRKKLLHRSEFISDTMELIIDMIDRLGDLTDDSISLGKRLDPLGGKKESDTEKLHMDFDSDINAALDEAEEILNRLGALP